MTLIKQLIVLDYYVQIDPRGVEYSMVVVVQLHPLFVTKVDRAYHVQCFYMEADKSVTASLDVR